MGDAARQQWSLTREAFDALLASLGPDREIAADRYLDLRRSLVRLFEWRGCSTPDEYADETINRCARKIGEGVEIRDLSTYAIGVARMLLREMGRQRLREARPLDQAPEPRVLPFDPGNDPESRLECLRRCIAQLPPEHRDLVLNYYRDDRSQKIRSRRKIAELFGIPAGALRMRVLRLRETLQLCTENCCRRGNRL